MSGNNNAIILFLIFFFILAVTITVYYFRCKIFQADCGKCKLFNFGCPDRIPEGIYYCQEAPGSLSVNNDGIQIVVDGKGQGPSAEYTYDKNVGTINVYSPGAGSSGIYVLKFDSSKNIISGADLITGSVRNLTFKLNGSPFSSTSPSPSTSPPRSSP